jgi:hypothetical protein
MNNFREELLELLTKYSKFSVQVNPSLVEGIVSSLEGTCRGENIDHLWVWIEELVEKEGGV